VFWTCKHIGGAHQWQRYFSRTSFSNVYNLGTKRDTTKEHEINLKYICSIDMIECFFAVSLSGFKLEGFENYEREQYLCH